MDCIEIILFDWLCKGTLVMIFYTIIRRLYVRSCPTGSVYKMLGGIYQWITCYSRRFNCRRRYTGECSTCHRGSCEEDTKMDNKINITFPNQWWLTSNIEMMTTSSLCIHWLERFLYGVSTLDVKTIQESLRLVQSRLLRRVADSSWYMMDNES